MIYMFLARATPISMDSYLKNITNSTSLFPHMKKQFASLSEWCTYKTHQTTYSRIC